MIRLAHGKTDNVLMRLKTIALFLTWVRSFSLTYKLIHIICLCRFVLFLLLLQGNITDGTGNPFCTPSCFIDSSQHSVPAFQPVRNRRRNNGQEDRMCNSIERETRADETWCRKIYNWLPSSFMSDLTLCDGLI